MYSNQIIETKALRELVICPPTNKNIKLPALLWLMLGRMEWMLSHKSQVESKLSVLLIDENSKENLFFGGICVDDNELKPKQGNARFHNVQHMLLGALNNKLDKDWLSSVIVKLKNEQNKERKGLENEIASGIFLPVMDCCHQTYRVHFCGQCKRQAYCPDLEGIASAIASDVLLSCLARYQVRDLIPEIALGQFFVYLAKRIVGEMHDVGENQCFNIKYTPHEPYEPIAEAVETDYEPDRRDAFVTMLLECIQGKLTIFKGKILEHVTTIRQVITELFQITNEEEILAWVIVIMDKKHNMLEPGVHTLTESIIRECCQNRNLFDIHQMRARDTLRRELEKNGYMGQDRQVLDKCI